MPESTNKPNLDALLEHGGWVRALARSLVSDAAAAEDVEQDSWVAVLKHRPTVVRNPRAWLATVVRNVAGMYQREQKARRRREELVGENRRRKETQNAPGAWPENLVERKESFRKIANALAEMNEPYGNILYLRYCEELTLRQIAERVGVSESTVHARVNRGLKILRGQLSADMGEDWRSRCMVFTVPLATNPVGGLMKVLAMTTKTKLAISAAVIVLASLFILEPWVLKDGSINPGEQGSVANLEETSSSSVEATLEGGQASGSLIVERTELLPIDFEGSAETTSVDAMPFGFDGVVLEGDQPVAGALVTYKGAQTHTDSSGAFFFPSFGLYRKVSITTQDQRKLFSISSEQSMVFQFGGVSSGKVRVVEYGGPADDAQVNVYLVDMDQSWNRLVPELNLLVSTRTDENGIAILQGLPSLRRDSAGDLIYCVVQYKDGMKQEGHMMLRWKRNRAEGMQYEITFRRPSGYPKPVRFLQIVDGKELALVGHTIYYKTSPVYSTPWHEVETDDYGYIHLRELDPKSLSFSVPMAEKLGWSSSTNPLVDTGSELVAKIRNTSPLIRLKSDYSLPASKFFVTRTASLELNSPRLPRRPEGPKFDGLFGWQPCRVDNSVRLRNGWTGENEIAVVRANPGGAIVASHPISDSGRTDIALPPLCDATFSPSAGASFPQGARLWLVPARETGFPAVVLWSAAKDSFRAILPYGSYRMTLSVAGVHTRQLGTVQISEPTFHLSIDIPSEPSRITFTFAGVPLNGDELSPVEWASRERSIDGNGVLDLEAALGDTIPITLRVESSANLRTSSIGELPQLFLGCDVRVPLTSHNAKVAIPASTLTIQSTQKNPGSFIISRILEDGSVGGHATIKFPSHLSDLKFVIPPGRYAVRSKGSNEDVVFDLVSGENSEQILPGE